MEEFYAIATEQGWNEDAMLAVALDYIANQQDDEAFIEHARRVADGENES